MARNWFSRWFTPTRRPVRSRPAARFRLEALEDRAVPATVTWVNPAGGDWDTPSDWSTGQLPAPVTTW
jgi:hypothetical protein